MGMLRAWFFPLQPLPSERRLAKFRNYSFGNIMLIARQKPDATNVAGLRTWNSLGRFVRRGEKGIFILAPMVGNKRNKEENVEQNTDAKETQRTLYGFRGVYVFDRLSRDLWPSLCALDVIRQCHFRKSPR
jgi:N-terminal domain of anti-restriction factor ArdC